MARLVRISYAGSGADAGLLSSPVPNAPKSVGLKLKLDGGLEVARNLDAAIPLACFF